MSYELALVAEVHFVRDSLYACFVDGADGAPALFCLFALAQMQCS